MFWKRTEEGEVEIRIVDWDVASIVGEVLQKTIRDRMTMSDCVEYYWIPKNGIASPELDAWFVFVMSRMNEVERDASYQSGKMSSFEGVNIIYRNVVRKIKVGR